MPSMYKKLAGKYVNNAVRVAKTRSHIKHNPGLPSGAHTEVSEVDRDMCAYVVSFSVETNWLFLLSIH